MKEIKPSIIEDASLMCLHYSIAINCCVYIQGHPKVTESQESKEI